MSSSAAAPKKSASKTAKKASSASRSAAAKKPSPSKSAKKGSSSSAAADPYANKTEAELNAELFELTEEMENEAKIKEAMERLGEVSKIISTIATNSSCSAAVVVPPIKLKHVDREIFGVMFRDTFKLTHAQKCNVINEFLLALKSKVFHHKSEKSTLKEGTLKMIDRYLTGDEKITPCSRHVDKHFGDYLNYLIEFLFTKPFFNEDTVGRANETTLNAFYGALWESVRSSKFGLVKYGPTNTKGGKRNIRRRTQRKI